MPMAPSAAISPDGRYVSYVTPKSSGDPGEIHVRDLRTGRDWRTTRIAQDAHAHHKREEAHLVLATAAGSLCLIGCSDSGTNMSL
jgi:hypothetical protein